MKRKGNVIDFLMKRAKKVPLFNKEVTLAHSWDKDKTDVRGWLMSEKLDGVRALWNGNDFVSRNHKEFKCRTKYRNQLPDDIVLDGELFNKNFKTSVSQVKSGTWDDSMRYFVFDSPTLPGTYEERYEKLKKLFKDHAFIIIHKHISVKNLEEIHELMTEILNNNGEGIMLRNPRMKYENGRSHNLLKYKMMQDDEAEVIDHIPGEGKHEGRLGALQCKYNGVTFKIGTGFSDAERVSPPKIGSKITFFFQELTEAKVPRFPVFKSIRENF